MLGIFCSDLHLTSKRPECRGDDWMLAQEKMLIRLVNDAKEYNCPIFIAGDVFHKPKVDPEIMSLAIKHLRQVKVYGIPGQHDMPGHNLGRLYESAFSTLIAAEALEFLDKPVKHQGVTFIGVPYGEEPPVVDNTDDPYIAIVHEMVWEKEPYPGAPKSGNIKQMAQKYKNFDIAVFGDNHSGFYSDTEDTIILNCGVAIRRTRAELKYKPKYYLIKDDLTVIRKHLPYIDDIMLEKDKKQESDTRLQAFVHTLLGHQELSLSFEANLKTYIETNKINKRVADLIWEIVDEQG